MFSWLKGIIAGIGDSDNQGNPNDGLQDGDGTNASQSDVAEEEDSLSTGTLKAVSAWDVADRYLQRNPSPTPFTVHALIEAGAADLLEASELLIACQKIEDHGYRHPINGVLLRELSKPELLDFIHWQARESVPKESYANENTILQLIDRFKISQ